MKKIKIKANAKLNLTLDVKEGAGGYHDINSLVTNVDIYDEITLVKRTDHVIHIFMSGLPLDCSILDNNAYRAASLFIKTYKTYGVDIYIKKNIPVGGGLGGSSANIAGVLNGLKSLYELDCDVTPLANRLGSDAGYMTLGGWATMAGRGELVIPLDVDRVFDVLVISGETSVSTKECYNEFDRLGKAPRGTTAKAVKALIGGDDETFYSALKNDLYAPAQKFVTGMKEGIAALKAAGAKAALMTGSGSAVFGIFDGKKAVTKAYNALKIVYGDRIVKTQTVNR